METAFRGIGTPRGHTYNLSHVGVRQWGLMLLLPLLSIFSWRF